MFHVRSLPAGSLAFVGLLAVAAVSSAQEGGRLASELGLTKATGSLPLWEKPAPAKQQELTDSVRSLRSGVFIVGHPKAGYGTAFVISKKHRLLATNAHVADIRREYSKLIAIQNDSDRAIEVTEVWYHPGVRRRPTPTTSIRSIDPAAGPVDPSSPDVAVLKLGGTEDLPEEFAFATKSEIRDLFASPVGMVGFPGHDTTSWPGTGENAAATFRQGVIARQTNFRGKADCSEGERQFVQHSMAGWFGFSGSPIFLPNGNLVAIHNSGATRAEKGLVTSLSYAVRVDALWELVAHHGLDDKLALPVKKEELLLDRYAQPDEDGARLREVLELTERAQAALKRSEFTKAVQLATQALQLAPEHAPAYKVRVSAYNEYAFLKLNGKAGEAQYIGYSLADAKRWLKISPSDADAYLEYCNQQNYLSYLRQGYSGNSETPSIIDRLLNSNVLTTAQRAYAYQCRGCAIYDHAPRLAGISEAVRLAPFDPAYLETRAANNRNDGYTRQADADDRRARELRAAMRLNQEALDILLEQGSFDIAWDKANEACRTTNYEYWEYLDTLAMVYSNRREFDLARRWGAKALQLAPDEEKRGCHRHLNEYEVERVVRKK